MALGKYLLRIKPSTKQTTYLLASPCRRRALVDPRFLPYPELRRARNRGNATRKEKERGAILCGTDRGGLTCCRKRKCEGIAPPINSHGVYYVPNFYASRASSQASQPPRAHFPLPQAIQVSSSTLPGHGLGIPRAFSGRPQVVDGNLKHVACSRPKAHVVRAVPLNQGRAGIRIRGRDGEAGRAKASQGGGRVDVTVGNCWGPEENPLVAWAQMPTRRALLTDLYFTTLPAPNPLG